MASPDEFKPNKTLLLDHFFLNLTVTRYELTATRWFACCEAMERWITVESALVRNWLS